MISIFKDINKFAGKWKWLDLIAIFCARYLPYLMVVFLFIFAILNRNWQILFYPLLSALFGLFIINNLIYFFYIEKRPAYLWATKLLIPVPKNPSFPSSHTEFFSAISFSLFFYNVNLAIIFLALTCLVGIARVFCGVHWFRDILGGLVAGVFSAIIIYYLLSFIK